MDVVEGYKDQFHCATNLYCLYIVVNRNLDVLLVILRLGMYRWLERIKAGHVFLRAQILVIYTYAPNPPSLDSFLPQLSN
jgi:hypothetical protein